MKSKKKKLLIALVVLILIGAAGAGIWYSTQTGGEPVPVFPFRMIGMTEYWGDNQESYGPVSTDRIQTVYITDTQTVTEVNVAVGDAVKKGDVLMTFDTTLTDLALERKRLDVEKLKLQMINAEARLQEIRAMKPMVIPSPSEDEEDTDADTGEQLQGSYQIYYDRDFDGSSQDMSMICWLNSAAYIDDALLEALRAQAEEIQNKNAEEEAANWTPEEPEDPDAPPPEPPVYTPFAVDSYCAIIKVTEDNAELGSRITWQGIRVKRTGSGFAFKLFDAYGIMDHSLSEEEDADTSVPEIDYGSGYTATQIAEMRREQEQKIRDLRYDIKMAETAYKIMQTEVSDGNVYAEIDGEVVSVLTEEEAKLQQQPLIKISGGGGFFVEGSISELEKDKLILGQEVTINDWNTGMTYPGKVTSIGDFPSGDNGWNGMGNPTASYYPFIAFVDETADLQAGSYTSIQFSTSGGENGIYLENPFIRSEQGNYFVYLQGKDGTLEKRYISVGKSLWGSYKEVLSGITEEDLIAFPYGKNIKEGAPTVESDLTALYE